jgi:hypothetical protein
VYINKLLLVGNETGDHENCIKIKKNGETKQV